MRTFDGIHYKKEYPFVVAVLEAYFEDRSTSRKELDYGILKILIIVIENLAKVT